MWSPRGQEFLTARRWMSSSALRAVACVAILAPALAACEGSSGFRPLYAEPAGGVSVNEKLAAVSFGTIPGRVGQRLRNELIFHGSGGGHAAPPQFHFDVTIRQQVVSTLVRKDGESQSQVYQLEAKFQLIRLSDKKIVLEGTSFGRAGFERYSSIFANVQAKQDAEDRAARSVAQDIKNRLTAFLSGTA